jgi:hypothetical protein
MATFAFSGGVAPVYGAGQKSKFRHGGTWAAGDTWSAQVTSQLTGDFTIGLGNIAGKVYTSCLTFKERAILGYEGGFAISEIDDPTGWEEQNTGAATFPFSNTYGLVDTVVGLSTTTGRLYTFGERTIQSWATDADPTKWVLTQVIDNSGTVFGGSVQAIGEIDVYYVDRIGFRSVQTKELTGDAFVGDIGTPIDSVISNLIPNISNPESVCSAISPVTKNYMCWLTSSFYNFAKYPTSKISAWSRFTADYTNTAGAVSGAGVFNGSGQSTIATTIGVVYAWVRGSGATSISLVNGTETLNYETHFTAQGATVTINGTVGETVTDSIVPIVTFTPTKLITQEASVYAYASDNYIYRQFGYEDGIAVGTDDRSKATVITPWLALNGGKQVQLQAIEINCVGQWAVLVATNPMNPVDVLVCTTPTAGVPQAETSSTVGLRRYAVSGNCSHVRITFVSIATGYYAPSSFPAKLCSAAVIFQPSNEK